MAPWAQKRQVHAPEPYLMTIDSQPNSPIPSVIPIDATSYFLPAKVLLAASSMFVTDMAGRILADW